MNQVFDIYQLNYLYKHPLEKYVPSFYKFYTVLVNNNAPYVLKKELIEKCKEVAEDLDSEECFYICLAGYMYLFGYEVEEDYSKAFVLFERAFNLDYNEANLAIVIYLSSPHLCKTNYEDIYRYLEIGANNNYLPCLELLGQAYKLGKGVEANYTKYLEIESKCASLGFGLSYLYLAEDNLNNFKFSKSLECYLKASELDCPLAYYYLGKTYQYGNEEVDIDLEKAITYYKKGIDLNDTMCMLSLGKLYLEGEVIERDLNLGLTLVKKSQSLGEYEAYRYLGDLLLEGKILKKNISLSGKYYLTYIQSEIDETKKGEVYYKLGLAYMEEKNYLKAYNSFIKARFRFTLKSNIYLAKIKEEGLVTEKDHKKAISYIDEILRKDDGEALYLLANEYKLGSSIVEQSDEKYVYLLKASADHCYSKSCFELADIYNKGLFNVTKDNEMSYFYANLGSKLGNRDCMFFLACFYLKGIFVDEDEERALELMNKAKLLGSIDAKRYLESK